MSHPTNKPSASSERALKELLRDILGPYYRGNSVRADASRAFKVVTSWGQRGRTDELRRALAEYDSTLEGDLFDATKHAKWFDAAVRDMMTEVLASADAINDTDDKSERARLWRDSGFEKFDDVNDVIRNSFESVRMNRLEKLQRSGTEREVPYVEGRMKSGSDPIRARMEASSSTVSPSGEAEAEGEEQGERQSPPGFEFDASGNLVATGALDAGAPIEVPNDFLEPIGGILREYDGPISAITGGLRQGNGYFLGDDFDILQSMPLEELARLQDRMTALGIGSGNMIRGELDDATVDAFAGLLALANRRNEEWQTTIERLQKQADAGELSLGAGEPLPTYTAPDYAGVTQAVRELFKERLRRDPTDAEMTLLADQMMRAHRSQFNANLAAEDAPGAGRVVELQDFDFGARLTDAFEKKYEKQLENEEAVVSRQTNIAFADQALSSFGRIMGGAR